MIQNNKGIGKGDFMNKLILCDQILKKIKILLIYDS